MRMVSSRPRDVVDFDDWIRGQLGPVRTAAGGRPPAGALRRLAGGARLGLLLQILTAMVAVTFFALGLLTGAPVPPIYVEFLPKPTQSLPVQSLGVAQAPALAKHVVVASATIRAKPISPRSTFGLDSERQRSGPGRYETFNGPAPGDETWGDRRCC